jgi:hypothetical protein
MSKRTSVAEVANLSSAAAAAPVLESTTQHFIDALAAAILYVDTSSGAQSA